MADAISDSILEHNYLVDDLGNRREDFFPGIIVSFEHTDNTFLFTCDNGVVLLVAVLTDKIVRFRFAVDGFFEKDFSYALAHDFKGDYLMLEFKEKEDHFHITTDRLLTKVLNRSGMVLSGDEKGWLPLEKQLRERGRHRE